MVDGSGDGRGEAGVVPLPAERLALPVKVRPHRCGNAPATRWVVADSGHHQVVLVGDDGRELARWGSGLPGLLDGPGPHARFHAPRGVCASCEAVWVADTGNHALRRIDLVSGQVTTLAGEGHPGGVLGGGERGRGARLAAPWDLELAGQRLLFANAGTGQLVGLDLVRDTLEPLAGDGTPGAGGVLRPCALAWDDTFRRLWWADGATGAVGVWEPGRGEVRTLKGGTGPGPGGLGEQSPLALSHPMGLALERGGGVWVSNPPEAPLGVLGVTGSWSDGLLQAPWHCRDQAPRPLDHPAGVAVDGLDRVVVADTNNHRLVEYRLGARQWRTLFR